MSVIAAVQNLQLANDRVAKENIADIAGGVVGSHYYLQHGFYLIKFSGVDLNKPTDQHLNELEGKSLTIAKIAEQPFFC